MASETKIICPNCSTEIDVNNVISHQLEDKLKKEFNTRWIIEKKKLDEENSKMQTEKMAFEKQKLEQTAVINQQVEQQLLEQKKIIEEQVKNKINEENKELIELQKKELEEKSHQLKELHKTSAELEKMKREKDELKEKLEAENEKKLNEKIIEEKEKIRKIEAEKNEMQVRELQKQLDDQKKLTEEMKRKQEQGSMQMQGEVQELGIEEWLKEQFPLDTIEEIKKGERGADCLQIVNTRSSYNCGTIYYESKRTKEFSKNWIEKFKEDIQLKNASIGVLVTEVFPKGMDRIGLVDGVWVCSYEEFKGLCIVLRENIIKLHSLQLSQENKGDKMIMLYDFLTGNEFKMQVEAIVEGFTQMQIDLLAEKRSMQGHWKKREKQIQRVLLNTTNMYSSIKGIAGAAIAPIKQLELPEVDDEVDE